VVATSAGLIIIVAGIAYLLARRITRPILGLSRGVRVIGSGNLDQRLEVHRGRDRGHGHRLQQDDCRPQRIHPQPAGDHHRQERIERTARDTEIQESMLPRLFRPSHRKEFDLYATMVPAREVGGDFYDFFFTSPNRLCIIIGDVCGKGIPAALFMAICKTLLRTEALHTANPGDVLFSVNNTLYPDNESSMFFTGLVAMLDTDTGEITIANGGHNPPLLCPSGGEFEYVQLPRGLVVGAMPDTRYESRTYYLKPHDTLVMYTDGVTEAMNRDSALYSEARLLECLNTLRDRSVKDIIQGVKADIDVLVQVTPPSDDITLVVLEFNGPQGPGAQI
jgi:sigma-B regulation protein RsbU (phosphoserine phosphatase)